MDWVAFTGICGTLLGVCVGAISAYMIQERQLRHTDKTRFHDERLAVYTEFLGLTRNMWSTYVFGGDDNEKWMERFTELIENIVVLGSKPVSDAAARVYQHIGDIIVTADRTKAANEVQKQLFGSIRDFRQAVREELGVSDGL